MQVRTSPHHPHTSQPSPEAFRAKFDELTKDGSPVVAILLSQVLSGTYQSAVLARDMLPDRNIEIVNSKLASCAYGVLARLAAEMADKGAGPSEIVSKVTEMAERTVTVFSVDTLDYLAKNGRIGKAQHFLGGLLNLKPILSLDKDGYVTAIERVRGKGKVLSRVMEILAERIPSKRLLAVSISHSDAPEEALKVKEAIQTVQARPVVRVGDWSHYRDACWPRHHLCAGHPGIEGRGGALVDESSVGVSRPGLPGCWHGKGYI